MSRGETLKTVLLVSLASFYPPVAGLTPALDWKNFQSPVVENRSNQ